MTQTAEEYASHTSIHGVPYIFDRELSYLDRFLWLLVTLAFLGLSISLTWNTWTQWREEQVCICIAFVFVFVFVSVSVFVFVFVIELEHMDTMKRRAGLSLEYF